jgi:hypothetical protein
MKSKTTSQARVQFKNTPDTRNSTDDCNHLKIVQKISQQHPGKALNPITIEYSHTGHSTLIAESIDVKVQNIQHGKNITCAINCNQSSAATLYTLDMLLVEEMVLPQLQISLLCLGANLYLVKAEPAFRTQ